MSFDVEHEPWRSHEFGNLALVRAVKKHPCLYDTTIPEYAKQDFTNVAWQVIADEFGCSVVECKKKWKCIRTVFKREQVLVEAKKKTKPYYLVKHMEFLLPFLTSRPKLRFRNKHRVTQEMRSSLKISEVIEDSTDENSHSARVQAEFANAIAALQNNEVSKTVGRVTDSLNKRTVQPVIIQCVKAAKQNDSPPNASTAALEDHRRQFILSLLPEVDEMSEKQFRTFKRKMFQMIDDVLLEPE